MNKDDICASIEMNFRQIVSLAELMLECDNDNSPNILTIRDLAQVGLNNTIELDSARK